MPQFALFYTAFNKYPSAIVFRVGNTKNNNVRCNGGFMRSLLLLCPKGIDIHQPTLLAAARKAGATTEEEAYAIAAQAAQLISEQKKIASSESNNTIFNASSNSLKKNIHTPINHTPLKEQPRQ